MADVDAALGHVEQVLHAPRALELEHREPDLPGGEAEVAQVVGDPADAGRRGGVVERHAHADVVPGPVGPDDVHVELTTRRGRAEHGARRVGVQVPGADPGRRAEPGPEVPRGRGRRGHADARVAVAPAAADVPAGAAVGVGRERRLAAVARAPVAVAVTLEAAVAAGVGDAGGVGVGVGGAGGRRAGRGRRRRGGAPHASPGGAGLTHRADHTAGAAVGVVEPRVAARPVAVREPGPAGHGHLDRAADAVHAELPARAGAAAGAAIAAVVGEVAAGARAVGGARAARRHGRLLLGRVALLHARVGLGARGGGAEVGARAAGGDRGEDERETGETRGERHGDEPFAGAVRI